VSGSCCSADRAENVSDCFDRGRRRQRDFPVAPHAPSVTAADGVGAAFSVSLEHGRIVSASFRASTCVTLVAFCERLCQLATGLDASEGMRLSATTLLRSLRGVPPLKQHRAMLALAAFHLALSNALSLEEKMS
jgi:NifU-like protein involved in Fe-S cluster formation